MTWESNAASGTPGQSSPPLTLPPEYVAAIQAALGGAESVPVDEMTRVVDVDIKIHTPDGTKTIRFGLCPLTSVLGRAPYFGTAATIEQAHEMVCGAMLSVMAETVAKGAAAREPVVAVVPMPDVYVQDHRTWPTPARPTNTN